MLQYRLHNCHFLVVTNSYDKYFFISLLIFLCRNFGRLSRKEVPQLTRYSAHSLLSDDDFFWAPSAGRIIGWAGMGVVGRLCGPGGVCFQAGAARIACKRQSISHSGPRPYPYLTWAGCVVGNYL